MVNNTTRRPQSIQGAKDDANNEEKPVSGLICWKYIPKTALAERGNGTDADYAVVCPPFALDYEKPGQKDPSRQPTVLRTWKAEITEIKVDIMDKSALPTIHHIVERIHDIPVLSIVSATVEEEENAPDASAFVQIQ